MFGIGLSELSIIFIMVLIVFGAGKLPTIATGLRIGVQNIKRYVTEVEDNAEKKEPGQLT